jgi:hypothetical protein
MDSFWQNHIKIEWFGWPLKSFLKREPSNSMFEKGQNSYSYHSFGCIFALFGAQLTHFCNF